MLVDTIPKMQIDIVIEDKDVPAIINTIVKAGNTGKVGDGKIFVSPVEMVANVRTGEITK